MAWIKDVLIFSDGDNVLPLKDTDYSIEVTDAAGNPVNKIDSVAIYYLTVRSAGNNT